jgi:hypothetical protein
MCDLWEKYVWPTLSVLKAAFVMDEIRREIFQRANIRSEKFDECSGEGFSAQLKKFPAKNSPTKNVLSKEFSGEECS